MRRCSSSAEQELKARKSQIDELVDDLLLSPDTALLSTHPRTASSNPDFQAWLTAIWRELSRAVIDNLAQTLSKTREAVDRVTLVFGSTRSADPAMQARIQDLLASRFTEFPGAARSGSSLPKW